MLLLGQGVRPRQDRLAVAGAGTVAHRRTIRAGYRPVAATDRARVRVASQSLNPAPDRCNLITRAMATGPLPQQLLLRTAHRWPPGPCPPQLAPSVEGPRDYA